MAVTSFATTSSGPITENVEKKILAGISATGNYTFSTALTPGIYSCKTKMLSDSSATPSVALTLGTSGKSVAVDLTNGALFKVASTETGGTFNSYTSNLSTTETNSPDIYNPGLNSLYAGSVNNDTDYAFRISAYNPSAGIYVGNDPASSADGLKYQKSTDLKAWTNITMPTLSGTTPNFQYYGKIHWLNNKWIYQYFDGSQSRMRYATSTDLDTWTYAGQFPEQSYYSANDMFAYFNGYYYAMIQSRYALYRSADLATWTQVYSGDESMTVVTNGTTIMASFNSTVIHSTDGATWVSKSNPNGYGSIRWAAAQPNGDYLFMNTNGAMLRYTSNGTLSSYANNPSNGGSYFYMASTQSETAKITWHVDKFYMIGRYDYSGRYDGIWPIDGTNVTWNNQFASYSSDNRTELKSIFSDGTSVYATVRASTRQSYNNYWGNVAIVKLISANVTETLIGTTAPMGSVQIGTGSLRIRAYGAGQCRFIEYTFNGGLNWYSTILDNSYYGGNFYNLYSAWKNVFIDANDQGFTALMQISSNIYSLRAVKNGNGFTFTITYIAGTSANGGFARLREGEFAVGIGNTQMLYSTNYGASWTQTTYQSNNNSGWGFYQGLYNPADGLYYGFDGASTSTYRTSANLATWSTNSTAITGNPGAVFKAHYSTSSKVAVVFGTNNYAYSLDMKTWVTIGTGSFGSQTQIEVASDGMWCISGYNGTYKVSANGKSFIDVPFTKPSALTQFYMAGYAGGKGFCIGTDYVIKNRQRLTEPNTIFELYKTTYGEL